MKLKKWIVIGITLLALFGLKIQAATSSGVTITGLTNLYAGTLNATSSITAGSGNGQIDIGSAGVRLTSDGDGAITFLGLGNGSDEDFTLNLDDTSNTIVASSSTGVSLFDFGTAIAVSGKLDPYDATGWNGSRKFATEDDVRDKVESLGGVYEFAIGDETTAITTGTAKVTWRTPFAMTVTAVRASLAVVSSSGIPTVDINEGGTTILSTKLTIDASEKTSTTAATAAVISDSSLADDAEITFDIDVAGTGAAGLKVKIYYTK